MAGYKVSSSGSDGWDQGKGGWVRWSAGGQSGQNEQLFGSVSLFHTGVFEVSLDYSKLLSQFLFEDRSNVIHPDEGTRVLYYFCITNFITNSDFAE